MHYFFFTFPCKDLGEGFTSRAFDTHTHTYTITNLSKIQPTSPIFIEICISEKFPEVLHPGPIPVRFVYLLFVDCVNFHFLMFFDVFINPSILSISGTGHKHCHRTEIRREKWIQDDPKCSLERASKVKGGLAPCKKGKPEKHALNSI